MTASTTNRIARLYEQVVGYNPLLDGWTIAEALDCLRWMRTAMTLCDGDPTAYTGPTLTKAQLSRL
jgi:hypothetical protein